MDFIRHSINWVRGEIFEMVTISIAGMVLTVGGFVFSKLGATPLAKAMLVPMVVIGLFFTTMGISGYTTNQWRLSSYEKAYNESASAFIAAEKKRVEGFQYMYTITYITAPVCFALAIGLFWFSLKPHARAAGIALVIFGLFALFIDAFSKERADIYYAKILKACAQSGANATTALGPDSDNQR